MKTLENADRRSFLRNLGIAGSALVAGKAIAHHAYTPPQTEGPFYPVQDQADKDANMRRVEGGTRAALGEKIAIRGFVLDAETHKPVVGAMVEFWQACASGRYDHPDDPNDSPLDPNFQYWAQVYTSESGEFLIKTVKPGAYQASPEWKRPPHIHVKVHRSGYPTLTTQIYFSGDPLNETDRILRAVPAKQRKLVIVNLNPSSDDESLGVWTVYFAKRRSFRDSALAIQTPELE